MWDCGPYADLYEELDYDYEEIDQGLRQPMEFAHNNMRAFIYDMEQGCHVSGSFKFEFGGPRGGRFKFDLTLQVWRTPDAPEFKAMVWMPYDRLCQIRQMHSTEGSRRTLLLNGESMYWEEAMDKIRTASELEH